MDNYRGRVYRMTRHTPDATADDLLAWLLARLEFSRSSAGDLYLLDDGVGYEWNMVPADLVAMVDAMADVSA